ncbi:spore coat protein U domain-containing protein [Deinococcus sp. 6GRE01]|uniref:spore coat protein U domain-containing protein n=1 Tax=Deinococcus sp. 6GRE01 TaxID=2745873 RepID=UPI001E629036|nr:spore coat protein U domain-containing protein [Deinococcus sp. 6GRE01]MCD0157402.1 spore coat protein U domain-containing protein [Deinococcus sp. 6GRE01]
MRRRPSLLALLAWHSLAAASGSVSTLSPSGSASYTVTVGVGAGCDLSTADAVFGFYDGAPLAASGTIRVTCTQGAQYSLLVTAGTTDPGGATVLTRVGGTETLEYTLDSVTDNSQYAALDDSDPLGSVTVTATTAPYVRTLNFLLYGGQTPVPGEYQAQHTVEITLLN